MTDYNDGARKRLDLEDVHPVAFSGGTAVLAQTYNRLRNGVEIATGEQPIAVCGVASPRDLEHSLRSAGFDEEYIRHALNVKFRGENATRLVSLAEQAAGDVEILADGGVDTQGDGHAPASDLGERTRDTEGDTGVSITVELSRGNGANDRDRVEARIEAETREQAEAELKDLRPALEDHLDTVRGWQP